jgi:hypothetical protein
MAYDYLEPVIPAYTVIPAKAGIQSCCEVRASFTTALDTRLRGPPVTVIDAFVGIASALFDRLVENEKQAQSIATLRDTLLPRLISGQLRLPEAESQIEAAMT